MAVQHLTYLDLSPEQRARAASEARGRIKTLLANPFLTPDQAEHLRKEQLRLGQWERGELPLKP
jgi:hypothetical protein